MGGANPKQIFIALLKFDFFFFVGFSIQFVVIVASTFSKEGRGTILNRDYEFYVTIAAIPITIVFLLCAAWCTRREMRYPMWGVVIVFHAAFAYFIFKLVRMYQKESAPDYKPARRSLTTFGMHLVKSIRVPANTSDSCNNPPSDRSYNRERHQLHNEL